MPRAERSHRRGGGIALLIAVGVVASGLVFLYLWQGAILSGLRAERAKAILALAELERVKLDLAYQVDRAYSLDEIARRARALGMVPFDEERTRYIVLEGGGH
ncbi:MAG: hypothetical protein Kow0097_02300 [Candidatus Bipolaricaulota bacterium]|nr:hypothetical protein [Candidatus Bipolaricaulota bacterium]